jgi:predicted DNA-binding protein with PD1-like motif
MHRYIVLALIAGCAPTNGYLRPADTAPTGHAPHAQHRLLASHQDGTQEHLLILHDGDEVQSAILAFAKEEHVVAARFTGIGAVRDPQVAWFDVARKQYFTIERSEQLEIVSLIGDVGVDENKTPIVHAHAVLGQQNGQTFGGHLLRATTSPNAEIFITTYPEPLTKRQDPEYDSKFFDLSATD